MPDFSEYFLPYVLMVTGLAGVFATLIVTSDPRKSWLFGRRSKSE